MRPSRAAAVTGAVAAVCALAFAAGPASGRADQEPRRTRAPKAAAAPAAAPVDARVADEIANYVILTRPGPEHRWLEPLVGSWAAELRWEAPERQPALLVGTSENRFILGGRFLQCETAVGEGPSRVEWTTIYGFDAAQKKFFALTLSNVASHVLQASGSYDPRAAGFLLSGRQRDETTGSVLTYREQLSVESPDRHVLRVYYDLPGRAPLKAVESTYTRR